MLKQNKLDHITTAKPRKYETINGSKRWGNDRKRTATRNKSNYKREEAFVLCLHRL